MFFLNSIKNSIKSLFFRPSSNIPVIDGLRAMAIFWVIFQHIWFFYGLFAGKEALSSITKKLPKLVTKGSYGVDTFFVISGFLITNILIKQYKKHGKILFVKFYFRRALRLLPAYYLLLLFVKISSPEFAKNVWANLLYVNNYLPMSETTAPWTWSLALEEQFYFCFPFLTLFLLKIDKWNLRILGFIFLLACAITISLHFYHGISFPIPIHSLWDENQKLTAYIDTFVTKSHIRFGALVPGAIISFIYKFKSELFNSFSKNNILNYVLFFLSLGGMYFAIAYDFNLANSGFYALDVVLLSLNNYLFVFPLSVLILLVLVPNHLSKLISKILDNKFWYPFAQLSYSAYLFHPFVIFAVLQVEAIKESFILLSLFSYSITFVTASVIYVILERPFMDLRLVLEKVIFREKNNAPS